MIHWTPVIRYQLLVKESCADIFAPKQCSIEVERLLLKLRLKSWKRVLILHLFKERLMNPNLEVILKNSAEGYGLNGTLETNVAQTLVTYLMSRVNLSGFHPRVTQRSKFS